MHYAVNAAVVENIKNVMHSMREVPISQVCMQGCAKALLGLNRAESQYGSDPVGWMTAEQQKVNKPSRIEYNRKECAQASAHVKQSPALVEKTQC
eukprot:4904597-Ditylum_brightwellii.AAC.1